MALSDNLSDPKIVAFLNLIAFSEGTSTHPLTQNNGYDVIVTGLDGEKETFADYSDHPFAGGRIAKLIRRVPLIVSTAAGRYRLLHRYWKVYKEQLHLPDYSPRSQDLVALQQIHERGAIDMIQSASIEAAIIACSNIWASLPGNHYGQGGKTMAQLIDHFAQQGALGDQNEG